MFLQPATMSLQDIRDIEKGQKEYRKRWDIQIARCLLDAKKCEVGRAKATFRIWKKDRGQASYK